MLSRTLAALALVTSMGCTAHEGDTTAKPTSDRTAKPDPEPDPQPEPEPEPEPEPVLAKASIASVVMIEDCPDRAPPPPKPASTDASKPTQAADQAPPAQPAQPAKEASAKREARMAPGAALADAEHGWRPPCSQSTMQIAFTGQGDAPGRVTIDRVRLLEPGTFQELARLSVRHPASWTPDGIYYAWDETLPAGESVKASYSLSLPDWSEVERKKAGASSYGHMFVLEVEVSIDGVSQTVRSQEFPREEAHVVVT